MKHCFFVPVEQICYAEGIGYFHTFGILATFADGNGQTTEMLIPDVSTDRAFVAAKTALFTALQLQPCHVFDAVADALAE